MKKNKRLLLSVGIFLSTIFGLFSNCTPVHAENYSGQAIWPSEMISNIYIKKLRADGSGKYQQARFIRRSEDNAFVYCLQPFVDINNNYVYQVARSDYEVYLNMSKEQFKKISLYAYYGYGYGNHSDHKWYAITQVMIWRTADPSSQFFFTNTLNGNRNDSLFASEIAELENLVNSHYVSPSFNNINNIKLPITNTISINDNNNKLSEYKISNQSNVSASINGNTLNITGTGIGNASIKLTKSDTRFSVPPIVYFNDHSQNVFRLGAYDPMEVNLNFEVIGGKVAIQKVDSETLETTAQGSATLNGAVYGVYKEDGTKLTEITTNGNGYVKSDYLSSIGKLYVQEIKPSTGYKLDTTKYYFELTNGNLEPTIQVKEQVIKGRIKIEKLDSETNSCKAQGQATLKGAIYEILDLKGNVVDTLTIGDDCTATSKYLPYSQYKIREKSQSKGYYIDTNIYDANITEEKIITITSKEQVIKNYISILKQYDYVDGTTQFLNAEANVKFEIYYPDGKKYGEITTDKNGYATLNIPYGVWKFHQVNTHTGFEKIYDFFITVDENSELEQSYNILNNKLSAYLQVFKIDSETGKTIALANTTFKILNVDTNQYVSQFVGGKVYSEFKTDESGKLVTYLKLEAGNYKLIETSSPKSYLINTDGLLFSIGNDAHYSYTTYGAFITVNFKDTPIKGQVEVNKTGEKFNTNNGTFNYEEIALENVVYNIYADEDIKSSDGQHLYYSKGTLVDVITTDKNGYAISKKLPLGKYRLVETKTDSLHVLDTKEYHFELTEVDNKTAIVYKSFSILNRYKKGELEFTKTDLVSGEAIPNTKIEIYTDSDELIFSGVTDKDGKIIIKDLPVNQKFYILEIEPATGYIKTDEKMYFEIKEDGEIVKCTMTNEKIVVEVPNTEENDSFLIEIISGIICVSGIGIIIYARKKSEEE